MINGFKKKLNIPLKITLPITLKSLNGFRVVLYQDNTLEFPDRHWYIIIRIKDDDSFISIIITSQKTKRRHYYRNSPKPKAAECLVEINSDDFVFLTKESAINCNEAKLFSIDELISTIDEVKGFKVEDERVEAYLRKEIVSAILKSPLTLPIVKRLAKEANPL